MSRLSLAILCIFSISAGAVDLNAINQALQSPSGVQGEVHGSDTDHGMYVFTFRNPSNFFDYVMLPIVGQNPTAVDAIAKLHRHDIVSLKGRFNPWINAAQQHIDVDSVTMVTPFDPGYDNLPPYHHEVTLPADVTGKTELTVKVHAIVASGAIMVVEYMDTVIPVIVQDPTVVQNLYRGDKILIQYTVSDQPIAPTHLLLNKGANSVQVLSAIVSQNGKALSLCGPLVLYVDSPDIQFNVFALQNDIGDGLAWTFTLLNNDDQIFAALRAKMQAEWDSHVSTVVRGRNFFINPKVLVCANGTGNEVDPTQANPQIFLNSVDDLTFQVQ